MIHKHLLAACLLWLTAFVAVGRNTGHVNPFIGTDGTGHTFPGPSLPFGFVQPGPDCKDTDWDYTSGYQYRDAEVLGFSQSHLSGTGIGELGDVLMLPYTRSHVANTMCKATEQASLGYYKVTKSDSVKVELTCSSRVAFHRYTYPSSDGNLTIDLRHGLRFLTDSLVLDSDVKIVNNRQIQGTCHTKNWVERRYSFVVVFDQPFDDKTPKSNAPKYDLHFVLTNPANILQAKVALSTTSVQGAMRNLKAEIPGWDFEKTRRAAVSEWAKYLNRIDIEADSLTRVKFYTALYHLLLQPTDIADVDGKYRGADNAIHQAQHGYYSTLSTWDVYRAAFPLLQIVAPERVDGIVQSMLDHHRQAGFLPIWTAWGQDNFCMIANHSIPMIVSAFNNGFKGFSADDALQSIYETSVRPHIHSDWELYNKFGYYPFDFVTDESVSKALENGYDDWCVADMAQRLGRTDLYSEFSTRAKYYTHLFDPESRLLRGKDSNGNWRTPFDPFTATSPMNNPGDYTEANAWQYFWTPAQHDVDGVISLLGGKDAFTEHLNTFFETRAINPNKYLGQEAMIGQYAHGNEPCHHIAYLYAYSNSPWKGQRIVHDIANDFYDATPDGMIGNDDCGQMSAWYIFACMGFYPVNPASGEFVFGAPQLKRITINLGSGKSFTIVADNYSNDHFCCDKISLNGNDICSTIKYREIMNGGELVFNMKPLPTAIDNEKYGVLPFGSIKPEGWLKKQMHADLNGIIVNLPAMIPELINDPIYSTGRLTLKSVVKDLGNNREGDAEGDEQYKWWNSETQSNWSDALIRNAILLGDKGALSKVEAFVADKLGSQDADGYMGIYTPELRFKTGKENGELWAKTTLLRGFLAYYDYSHSTKLFNSIKRAVDNVMDHWKIYSSHPFDAGTEYNGGTAHGLTFTDILDRMYQLTGDARYRDYALFLYTDYSANFSSEQDAQLANALNPDYRLKCHGVHSYEHIRPMLVAASTSTDPEMKSALNSYLAKVAKLVTPTGGAIGDEWIQSDVADGETTGYEYCSLHELLDSYSVLLQKRGDVKAAEQMENIFYNAAQGSRHPHRPAIAYLKTDNSFEMNGTKNGIAEPDRKQTRYKYSPVHQDVAVCCVPNAMRISPYFLQKAWMSEDDDTLTCNILVPNTLTTQLGNNHISVSTITDYPFGNKLTFSVTCDKPFTMKVRRPSWCRSVECSIPYVETDGYLVFNCSGMVKFRISFRTEVRIIKSADGRCYFAYGPLVYALPIKATEKQGREYLPGYSDYTYLPVDLTKYRYTSDCRPRYKNGRISVTLINETTGAKQRVSLVPLKDTVLRQVCF